MKKQTKNSISQEYNEIVSSIVLFCGKKFSDSGSDITPTEMIEIVSNASLNMIKYLLIYSACKFLEVQEALHKSELSVSLKEKVEESTKEMIIDFAEHLINNIIDSYNIGFIDFKKNMKENIYKHALDLHKMKDKENEEK